ncbi:hypothetical protein [Phenylobacterium sp.]|uniref:hypothetical protein n=1 Tax=Phenylobacterium sp. TaxID=1871053 RepID=UPI00260BEF8E|nr:hypothetical protein [Phenylobacterium sp.]
MSGEPDNIVLQYLPRIDKKVDQLIQDVRDLKGCVCALEDNMVVARRRLDRVDERLDRIERRPDIIDAPPGVRE